MTTTVSTPQEAGFIVARAKTQLMLKQPFFGALAMSLPFKEDSDIPTMCTDGKSVHYNPEFVESLSLGKVMGVIAHEVMHVAFCHPLRIEGRVHEVWNMATDYAINQIVVDSGLELPEVGLLDPQYKGMMAEAIYNLLMQNPETQPEGKGWDFGEITQPVNDDGSALSESEAEVMESDIHAKVLPAHTSAKNVGKTPAGLDDYIDSITTTKVDWTEKLRLFIGGDQPDDYTMSRPNRKLLAACGVYMPSVDHYGAGHVVVALDSSRSVTLEELNMYLSEINGISEDMQPETLTIIVCDTEIQSVTTYYRGEVIESLNAKGRGGTLVGPVFAYIDEHGLPVDSMVYFTDLLVHDFPEAPDYPVLWVSTGSTDAPFGEVVSIS